MTSPYPAVKDEAKRLQEKIRLLEQSQKNKDRLAYWNLEDAAKDALARPVPKKGVCPFTVELDRVGFARVLGFSLVDFSNDPECYLINSLRITAFRFEEFRDCTPISKTVAYFAGSGFEKSLFGGEQVITEEEVWVDRENAIKERVDLSQLEIPDFFENRVMKFTHTFCQRMQELLDDDFTVEFPQWNRSAFGVAWHLRGIDGLLMDAFEDPEWFCGFLRFINQARMQWSDQRQKFLNVKKMPCSLYNDEVGVPVLSPELYREFVLPSEKEIGAYYGGINYWHSCGDTTPLFKDINTIPNLSMVHVGGWSDEKVAMRDLSPDKAVQKSMRPYDEIIGALDRAAMRRRLVEIKENLAGRLMSVSADALQVVNSCKQDMAALKVWIDQANDILLDQ